MRIYRERLFRGNGSGLTRQDEGVFVAVGGGGGGINDEADASDVEGAGCDEVFGAVAEISHLEMGVTGELEPGGDEHSVDFDAGSASELEVELGGLVSLGGAGEDPSPAGEQCSGEIADEALRLVRAEGGEPEAPSVDLLFMGHMGLIGWEDG
jgi:hypothetical protein